MALWFCFFMTLRLSYVFCQYLTNCLPQNNKHNNDHSCNQKDKECLLRIHYFVHNRFRGTVPGPLTVVSIVFIRAFAGEPFPRLLERFDWFAYFVLWTETRLLTAVVLHCTTNAWALTFQFLRRLKCSNYLYLSHESSYHK